MRQVEAVEQLALFETGPDIAELRREAEMLKQQTRSKATLNCYDSDWKAFTSWCALTGRTPLPTTSDTLELYIASRLRRGFKVTGTQRQIAAIAFQHKRAEQPMCDRSGARLILNGAARRRKETPRQRTPLMPDQLRRICTMLVARNTGKALRDRAILTLGFATGLRRSNLAALDLRDVTFVPDKGVAVSVRASKTDQFGRGVIKPARRGEYAESCPERALQDWLRVRGEAPGPLFWAADRTTERLRHFNRRMGKGEVNLIVKEGVALLGIKADGDYGAHSLRAGFVTTAHVQGAGVLAIMEQTGHTTVEMVKRYLRNADPFAGPNPLGRAI